MYAKLSPGVECTNEAVWTPVGIDTMESLSVYVKEPSEPVNIEKNKVQ